VSGPEDRREDIDESQSDGDYNGKGAAEVADGRKGSKYLVGHLDEDRKFHEDADQIVNPICGRICLRA
jgi:hypothetical protein